MLGMRPRLGGLALATALVASDVGSPVNVSGPWRRTRSRRDWLRTRDTKRSFDALKRLAKRKAQRRARRITRMHAR